MSRTWKREPTRRYNSEYVEMEPYGQTVKRLETKRDKAAKKLSRSEGDVCHV